METDDLLELADDPRFISGIHNYCDRWCERCPFSARCMVYAVEQADEDDDPESRDINNKKFWDRLQGIFQQTAELMRRWAEENGISLDEIALEAAKQERESARKAARESDLARAADAYVKRVEDWFNEHEARLSAAGQPATDLATAAEDDDQNEVREAAAVIRWYQFLIAVKLRRGLMQIDDDEEETGFQKDSDGSVKVSLIGIDRSIGAWGNLERHLGEDAGIRPVLLHLERLRRNAEHSFPNARGFIRPGFDEGLDGPVS
ncbi:MAG TPA: hypothetical protein VN345_13890 [Blastocatellia bacterium]|nr:hypothetical protein [Blastocatellia bacterium]